MRRGFIVTEDEEHGKRRIPVVSSVIIGRAADCDVTIEDAAASRHHAQILYQNGSFCLKDMGSTNGTIVNANQSNECTLTDGDIIRIGETELFFEVEEVLPPTENDESALFRTLFSADGSQLTANPEETKVEAMLRAIYTVMNQITSSFDLCSLVDQVLEASTRTINAQRAAVLFAGTDGEDLLPCPACSKYHVVERGRLRHVTHGNVRIGGDISHRVLNRGESVLQALPDTGADETEDLASQHPSMCVPLRGKYGIPGLLYLESTESEENYTREDMLLSTAVGHSAGLAIETAQSHQERIEKERLNLEISHATTLQEAFLVDEWPTDNPRYQVYGETRPARMPGCDFYDFVQLDADRVGLLIGDVSGRGEPAALTMTQVLSRFRLAVRESAAPHQVIAALNENLLKRSTNGSFCTLCYTVVDLATSQVLCANAGHCPVLCVSPKASREFGPASGPPIGITPNGGWTTLEEKLNRNETLLMFTNGIIEARGLHTRRDSGRPSDEFGMRNLTRVAQGFGKESPRDIISGILLSVLEYTAPTTPHDDCTLIGIQPRS